MERGSSIEQLDATASRSDDCLPAPLQTRDPARYRILAEHGRGGLGRVYRARDKELGRDVALKELLQPSRRAELRFFREALITARLEHPSIVPVHEAGHWPDGTPFYSMKLVAGRSLSELLAQANGLDQRLALLPHLVAVADAIAYAHDRQIIHRDLKPANVVIGEFGETIVVDWGLAKELTENIDDEAGPPYRTGVRPDVTVAGTILGTPNYMSPEQARGDLADARSDVYSLGAMLYQLCTGAVPKAGATTGDLRRELRRIHEDLATIALKALSASPAERYPDASAFAGDLRAYDAGARITARTYSLAAILRHWLGHHKRLAVTAAIPTFLAAIMGAAALREIILERDRAAGAQREAESAQVAAEEQRRTAETERDLAIRSQAAMLLERDPTKARDLLATRKVLTPEEALLLARARGAGTGDHVITLLPFKVHEAVADDNLEMLTIAASDNKLRSIDLSTGRVDVVEDKFLWPTFLVKDGHGVAYTRHGINGPELVRTADPAHPVRLLSFRGSADNAAVATAAGLYMLSASGNLSLLTATGQFRSLGHGFRGIAQYHDGLLACTAKHLLRFDRDGLVTKIGSCRHNGPWRAFATSGDDYVVQASPTRVVVQRHGVRSVLSISESNEFVMATSGLVVGADEAGRTWYVSPGRDGKTDGPASKSKASAVGADGALAAWGYMDGIARVRDVRTGATWTFTGHSGPVIWIFVSERLRRVVTAGGPDVRVWSIPPFSLRPVGTLPRGAFFVVPSPDGKWVAFDGADGTVSLVRRDDISAGVRTLHRHDGSAYSVAWRDNEVCSAGWDGKVICTDVVTRQTKILAQHNQPIRFVHSAGQVLAYTVEDGGVWAHVTGEAAPKFLYTHRAEPYRVAVSNTGDVASGASDGSVMVYERATGIIHRASNPHTDRVYQTIWRGDELQTSSHDGTIRTWSKDLVLRSVASASRAIRDLELLSTGWIANVGGTRLLLRSDGTDLDLETGPFIWDLSVSTDSRFASAVVGGDLIVYDLRDKALAAVRVADSAAHCVQFVDATTMFVCAWNAVILSISVETLPFVKFYKERTFPEE